MNYKYMESSCHSPVMLSSHQFVLRIRKIATNLSHNTAWHKRGSNWEALKQIRRVENVLSCLQKKVINMDNNYSTSFDISVSYKVTSKNRMDMTSRGAKLFRQSRNHLRTAGVWTLALSKFHTENPKIFGLIVKNLGVRALCEPWYCHTIGFYYKLQLSVVGCSSSQNACHLTKKTFIYIVKPPFRQ